MLNRSGQVLINVIILILFLVFIIFSVIYELPLNLSFLFIVGCGIFMISFLNPGLALIILIFSMLLSPEFSIGAIPGRAIVLRADDMFLFIIILGWFAKTAVNKEIGLLKSTPLNAPIFAYITVCLLSTFWGIVRGYTRIGEAVFYNVKYIEYFLIYFMVVNNLKTRKQAKMYVSFLLITCAMVCMYAYKQIPTGVRVSAPFEGVSGEANTFAGYLLLMIGVVVGFLVHSRSLRLQIFWSSFLIFISVPFVYTLSRSGWLGAMIMYISFIFFSKKKKGFLLLILLCLILFSRYIFPTVIVERVKTTFIPGTTYDVLGKKVTIDESASARVNSWKNSLKTWSEHPIIGTGIPGGGVVSDVQYGRVLREVGIVGSVIFVWIIIAFFKSGWRCYMKQDDDFSKGLSLGFMCSLVGLLIMGSAIEVFIVIRIMEPFWFIAAIVVALPEIVQKDKNESA